MCHTLPIKNGYHHMKNGEKEESQQKLTSNGPRNVSWNDGNHGGSHQTSTSTLIIEKKNDQNDNPTSIDRKSTYMYLLGQEIGDQCGER